MRGFIIFTKACQTVRQPLAAAMACSMSRFNTGASYHFHQSGQSSSLTGFALPKELDPCQQAGTTVLWPLIAVT